MKEYKAYIFDLDGTLLDSMGLWDQINIDFFTKRGITLPADYVAAISSMTFYETAVYTVKRFALPDSAGSVMLEWNDMAAYAYGHTVRLKPYAKEYLLTLRERGARLAVATSLFPELCGPVLRNNGIENLFHAICNTNETEYGKSRPDVFLLAAREIGVTPGGCLVFEDILIAVKSAKSAGMDVCAVYDRKSENDWEEIKEVADYAINDFRDAPLPAGKMK